MNEVYDLEDMLADQVGKMLDQHLDRSIIDTSENGQWPDALWQTCVSMELPLLLVDENLGGSGLSWSAAYRVFKILGSRAVPLPIGETILAARLLADAGLEIPPGPLSIAWANSSNETTISAVPWARNSGHLVLARTLAESIRIECLELDPCAIIKSKNIGRDPRDTVNLAELKIVQSSSLPINSLNPALVYGSVLRSAQIAGALQKVTQLAIEHANTRVQFGRPISKFQSVQQSLAVLASEAVAVDIAAHSAAASLDHGEVFLDVAAGKIRASQAAGPGSAKSHQAHGAIGFTDEYELHIYTRRLLSWRDEFGSETYWARRLGRYVLARNSGPWETIVSAQQFPLKPYGKVTEN